ncbi:hypothetical protein CHLNCDRAFT_59646 [Chlorella variabilis]|uniref:AB hydrolase-1 domain-containing protein n=1 Tax=Chlorella variabilis TaxID=554065 RepID=E1ZBX4_CHLVA|nr:hypothetical protein CHLNCDRAFT_59646 [Chlorella variabilis]EFN56507.1 hypothetical protein CHLNCDRAFT_59646 [Chlorella variabilis]|eukprot:XP_005848609.1 hypothetical protein CHLNCDRAFT_59646 [Chlorella variabilis]
MGHRSTLIALWLWLACVVTAAGAGPPPQCDAEQPLINVTFLGPAQAVDAGGISFSYHRFGNASAGRPPLILIHGLGGTQFDWPLTVLQYLSGSREVIIFDNQRAGLSNDSSNATLTIAGMAASTAALIRALELLRKPDVLGFSMGGMIAQALAGNHSDAVGAVVSVSGSSGGANAPQPAAGLEGVLSAIVEAGPSSIDLVFPLGANDTGFCNLLQTVDSVQFAATPGLNNDSEAGYALRLGIIPGAGALVVPPEVKQQQMDAILAFYTGPGLLGSLRSSTSQLLLLGGAQDAVVPPATQAQAATNMVAASLQEVPDAGHLVHFQHPAQYAQQVAAFLDSAQSLDPEQLAPYFPISGAAAVLQQGACLAAWSLLAAWAAGQA